MLDKKQLHSDVFKRKSNDVPLMVAVSPEDGVSYTNFECMRDPQKAIKRYDDKSRLSVLAESDYIPMIESNFLEVLVPSIFGGQMYESPGGNIDVKPFINTIYETETMNISDIFRKEMENAIKHLEYIKKNAPDYLYVNPSRPMSPLDYAVIMRGGDFYMDLALEPELCMEFMNKILDVTIKTTNYFKELLGQPKNEFATTRGLIFPGIRLTGDAVVNLSPAMIEDILWPVYKRFEEEYEMVMLHYCCLPAPAGHVLPALAGDSGISHVDNWQGYQTFFKPDDDICQTHTGICTDIKAEDILSGKVFKDPFFTSVPRPLTVSVKAKDVEEGKRLYHIWKEKMSV